MNQIFSENPILYTVLLGSGATAFMDSWALFLKTAFGIQRLDYRLLGRWIGHFRFGKFSHSSIAQAPTVPGELFIGWTAHYGIGMTFAGLLVMLRGSDWIETPTLLPALLVGIVTVVAPYLILQPAFGMGIAGAKTPRPSRVRLKSLMTHTSYGLGLYLTAILLEKWNEGAMQ